MKKEYLILGASSDLGTELIFRLLNAEHPDGLRIIAHYNRSCETLEKLKAEYPQADIELIKANLGDVDEIRECIQTIKGMDFLPTHIVNFSARPYRFNRLSELDVGRMELDMTIQLYSIALVCQAFLPDMAKRGYGKVVVMLSAAVKGAPPKFTGEYTTVKYALMGFIKSLAADYGECGINVNAVAPGMIETKFIKDVGRKVREITAQTNPRHRNLLVQDVVPAIMLLLSDDSQFMNGTVINLSGTTD